MSTIAPINVLLPRLERVIPRGSNRWMARCPSHEDRSPSLSVEERTDGALLVHCFAGCTTAEVLQTVDLSLADLFPDKFSHPGNARPRWNVKDVLVGLSREFEVVLIAANDIVAGKTLTEEDLSRVTDATRRVQRIKEICDV
jgi:hypothetical protein